MQTIVLQSLHSSGASTLTLNIALGIKALWPEKKIGIFVEGMWNDVLGYCALNVQKLEGFYSFMGLDIIHNDRVLLEQGNYDYLCVDLDRSAPLESHKYWKEQGDFQVDVLTLNPNSLRHYKSQKFYAKRFICFNKVQSKKQEANILKMNDIFPDLILPFDKNLFWKESFMGIPVLEQSPSQWSKTLIHFLKTSLLHA